MLGKSALKSPKKQLFGPTQHLLEVVAHYQGHLTHKEEESYQHVFVITNLKTSPTASSQDGLLWDFNHKNWKRKFPKVFQGLGTLSGDYHIQLRPDAKPHALFTLHHVALPLRPKVAAELERMEKAGVISKVSEPTQWYIKNLVVYASVLT